MGSLTSVTYYDPIKMNLFVFNEDGKHGRILTFYKWLEFKIICVVNLQPLKTYVYMHIYKNRSGIILPGLWLWD
jgi:hypothetical protein